jgi:hypothetical protein
MLFRICLIAAIVFGLAVTGLNLGLVKGKIDALTEERNHEHDVRVDTEHKLADTRSELKKTTAELNTTKQTLATTTQERDTALASLDAQTKRADKLTDDLKKTTAERDDAQANLASYVATGLKPPEILAMGKEFKVLQSAIKEAALVNKAQALHIVRLTNELAKYKEAGEHIVPLPPTAKGIVLVTDPKWNFVVLNFGEDQGALEDGELLVNRNGKLVAKVRISSVQKERCVANVVAGWQLGDVLEGDSAIPAHPSSS